MDYTGTYNKAILAARTSVRELNDATIRALDLAYMKLVERIVSDVESGRITAERAASISESIRRNLAEYGIAFESTTTASAIKSASLAAKGHALAVSSTAALAGKEILTSFDDVPKAALEWMIHRRDFANKMGATGFSSFFRTVTRANVQNAASEIDEILQTAVALGTDHRTLTTALAKKLTNDEKILDLLKHLGPRGGFKKSIHALGRKKLLEEFPAELLETRSLLHRSRKIAVHEINSAFDEADKLASARSPLIQAVQWKRSGRHANLPSTPDQCDLLADGDYYNLGAGVYPPEAVPSLPHPFCLCYTSKLLRPVSQWTSPKDATPNPRPISTTTVEDILGKNTTRYSNSVSTKRLKRELASARDAVSRARENALDPALPLTLPEGIAPPTPVKKAQTLPKFTAPPTPAPPVAALPEFDTLAGGYNVPRADTSWKDLPLAEKRRYADRFISASLPSINAFKVKRLPHAKAVFRTMELEELQKTNRNLLTAGLPEHALDDINRALADTAGRFNIDFDVLLPKTESRALGMYWHSVGQNEKSNLKALAVQKTYAKNTRKEGFKNHEYYISRRNRQIEDFKTNLGYKEPDGSISKAVQSTIDRLEAAQRWSLSSSMGPDGVYATTVHEAGHALYYQTPYLKTAWEGNWKNFKIQDKLGISEYGATNASEGFTETFTAVISGQADTLPEPVLTIFLELMKNFKIFRD